MKKVVGIVLAFLMICSVANAVELKGDTSKEAQEAFEAFLEQLKKQKGVVKEVVKAAQEKTEIIKEEIIEKIDEWQGETQEGVQEPTTVVSDTVMDTVAKKEDVRKEVAVEVNCPEIRTANITSAEVTVNLKGRQINANASVKMVRDSIIQLSLRMLGIEGARVDITPRRVTVYNKIQGRYYEKDIAALAAATGLQLEFADLQSLLTNNLLLVGDTTNGNDNIVSKSEVKKNADGWKIENAENAAGFAHQFTLDRKARLTETMVNHSKVKMTCSYKDFAKCKEDVTFPMSIYVRAQEKKENNSVQLQIKRAEFNKEVTINKTNKAKYTRVDEIEEIVKQ